MCAEKDIKSMTVHDMRMSVAKDDIKDAGMLIEYALAARSHGDDAAYKQFAEAAQQRIDRVEHCCGELRKML